MARFRTGPGGAVIDDRGGGAILVAAADSASVFRDRADYVCTGAQATGGDQDTINTALGVGDCVMLAPGTYWVDDAIELGDNQSLIGYGSSSVIKIMDADNANLKMITNSDAVGGNSRILVQGLKLDGNKAAQAGGTQYGIYFETVGSGSGATAIPGAKIDGCLAENFRYIGIYLNTCLNCSVLGNTSQLNSGWGIYLLSSSNNTICGNMCQGNTLDGIKLEATVNTTIDGNSFEGNLRSGIVLAPGSDYNIITNNVCNTNTWYGIRVDTTDYNSVTGNICYKNDYHGIYVDSSHHNSLCINTLTDNSQDTTNTYDDIYLSGADYNNVQGNTCRAGVEANKPRYGINISNATCNENLVVNNDLYDDGFATGCINDAGTLTHVESNRGLTAVEEKVFETATNTSGGDLVAGDVVVLKAVAAGNEIDTTVAAGNQMVWGMLAENIADAAKGLIQTRGKTTALKVNGTVAIAIGDLISTHTDAGIGMKAAAGTMAFAVALEVYAVANSGGVIDALLVVPRQAI